ncbi:porimin [Pleurodeles waltl]|uniref:porimin n=1 Tax=Pleurodeles waltl TaxID=8319 RepID=UPI0037098DC7
MRLHDHPLGLWLLCALLSAACTFCTANVNVTDPLPASISTTINVTAIPEVMTPDNKTPVYNETTPPQVNGTTPGTPSSNVTTTSNETATTKASSTPSAAPTKPVTTNGSITLASTTVPNTPGSSGQSKTSKFDAGSFVGGIVLTLGILIVLYLGCKFYASKRGVQYRTIDEHEAII